MASIAQIAEALEGAVSNAQAAFNDLKKGDPDEMIRVFVRVGEDYERLDAARKALNALLEGVSRNYIPELLEERSIKTISLDDIKKRITVSLRISCSITDKDKGFQWLRENDAGSLIQPTVNAGTLSSFAKQYMEEKGKELPADIFKMSSMKYTSVTKIK